MNVPPGRHSLSTLKSIVREGKCDSAEWIFDKSKVGPKKNPQMDIFETACGTVVNHFLIYNSKTLESVKCEEFYRYK